MQCEYTYAPEPEYDAHGLRESGEDYYSAAEPCYYCGLPAETVDHVVSQSLLDTLRIMGDDEMSRIFERRHKVKTVPACRECNCLIGSKYFPTLAERRQWLKNRLRKRYAKALATPHWSDSELAQLSEGLRNYVLNGIAQAETIRRRIAY